MVNKMKDLIVIGAGDLAKDVTWLIERINKNEKKWNLLGFTEKNLSGDFMGYHILGDDSVLENYRDVYVVCAIANLEIKEKVMNNLPENVKVATLIDDDALIHPSAHIGEGSLIFAKSIVGVGANVGKNCIVLYNGSVNHDVLLGDYSVVYPSATIAGKCVIGKYCEIGTGASLIQGITVCDNAKIGVGASVFTNIDNPGMTIGNPAVTMGSKKKVNV